MTKDEAIALALRIAADAERAGLPPVVMLCDELDGRYGPIHVYDSETCHRWATLHSERAYEGLLAMARESLKVSLN